jgi:hypothetical protein
MHYWIHMGSSVSIVTGTMGWTTGDQFLPGAIKGFFCLIATVSRSAVGPTQPPIQ